VKPKEVLALCRERNVKAVDLRFMDFRASGSTSPSGEQARRRSVRRRLGFDGSSIRGVAGDQRKRHDLVPQPETAVIDPFTTLATLSMICNIRIRSRARITPATAQRRRKAVNYLKSTALPTLAISVPKRSSSSSTTFVSTAFARGLLPHR